MATATAKEPYGPKSQVAYADPGYQADKKARYPLDSKAHARAAYSYISMPKNAKAYTGPQLKRIKGRIMAALKKFGVTVSAESVGWTFDEPILVSEALAEHLGMSSCAGSWSVRASNGPVDICLSSYSMDPEDLDIILRAAADAACKALAALDPDMDGDVDLPGVSGDTDPDGDAPGESAPDGASPTDPAAGPAAATTETEDPAMAETTTPAAGSTPAIDPTALAEAVTKALAQQEAGRKARKAEKRAARESAAASQSAASAAPGQGIPATAGATAAETAEQREARLKKLVDEQFAAAAAKEGLAVTETDEQLIARMLEERLVPLRQARAEAGGVQRKGIAQLETLAESPQIGKQLQEASNEDLKYAAGAAYGPRGAR
jgi:hypothetical protein